MSATQYARNIKEAVSSLWHGMSVTASYLLRRPTTIQYPDVSVKETLAPRYRGLLEVDTAVCTGCQACERACPINCIGIGVGKDPADPKSRVLTRFDIDAAKCMYCGLCVEACPTGSLVHTREFEAVMASVDNLTLRYVEPGKPVPVYKIQKGVEPVRAEPGTLVTEKRCPWGEPSPLPSKSVPEVSR